MRKRAVEVHFHDGVRRRNEETDSPGHCRFITLEGHRIAAPSVATWPRDRTFAPLEEMGCRCVELPVASKGTNPRDDLKTLAVLYRDEKLASRSKLITAGSHARMTPAPGGEAGAQVRSLPTVAA